MDGKCDIVVEYHASPSVYHEGMRAELMNAKKAARRGR